MNAREVHLVEISENPNLVDLADREKLGRGATAVLPLNFDARVDVARKDLTIDGRGERVALSDRIDVSDVQQILSLARALELGLRAAIVVFRSLEIRRRACLLLVELFAPPEVVLCRDEIRLGLVNVAHGVADIRRFDDGERVALFYGRPERRENLQHAPSDGRKYVSRPLIVERHGPGGQNGVVDGLLGDRD